VYKTSLRRAFHRCRMNNIERDIKEVTFYRADRIHVAEAWAQCFAVVR